MRAIFLSPFLKSFNFDFEGHFFLRKTLRRNLTRLKKRSDWPIAFFFFDQKICFAFLVLKNASFPTHEFFFRVELVNQNKLNFLKPRIAHDFGVARKKFLRRFQFFNKRWRLHLIGFTRRLIVPYILQRIGERVLFCI